MRNKINSENKYKSLILFDFDGVIINSLPCMRNAWKAVEKEYNLGIQFRSYAKHIGKPFFIILDNLKIPKSLHVQIDKLYSEASEKQLEETKMMPYANFLLSWLKENSYKTGLVTSKKRSRTKKLVSSLNLEFDVVITPEDTERGKTISRTINICMW